MGETGAAHIVEIISPVGFLATLERLVRAISGAGMTVFATIDHAEGARSVGLAMPPTTVLIYGNPKGGTPVMLATPVSALDLPLRVLVREASDEVLVAFHPVADVLMAAGAPEDVARRLEPAQRVLLAALQR
jgi:uncharacterized protein (DUF302 family)